MDDDVREPPLVLQEQEDDALRRLGPLAADHEPRHPDRAPGRQVGELPGAHHPLAQGRPEVPERVVVGGEPQPRVVEPQPLRRRLPGERYPVRRGGEREGELAAMGPEHRPHRGGAPSPAHADGRASRPIGTPPRPKGVFASRSAPAPSVAVARGNLEPDPDGGSNPEGLLPCPRRSRP